MIALTRERRTRRQRRKTRQTIRFTPYAWAKLIFLRDVGHTEVGGFGISREDDPLLIEDIALINQVCTTVSVEFDDESVADFFEHQVDEGRRPDQFARVWIHTHPGHSPTPSGTDEETFERCFGSVDWAVMFILSQTGQTYARLQFNVGPGTNRRLAVAIDYQREFDGTAHPQWQSEYAEAVRTYDRYPERQHGAAVGTQDDGWPIRSRDDQAWCLEPWRIGDEVTQ